MIKIVIPDTSFASFDRGIDQSSVDDVAHAGATLTDTAASSWTFISAGTAPDWSPVAFSP
ncbi:MAG TPA: hypothetical protein VK437_07585 [Steroidobacteraceae bacterium]|nr:hypothetical protein [Steroidobacteraceae bacterium]